MNDLKRITKRFLSICVWLYLPFGTWVIYGLLENPCAGHHPSLIFLLDAVIVFGLVSQPFGVLFVSMELWDGK